MRNLYLPIEHYYREFDPKLYLACHLLLHKKVDRVVIGDQKFLLPFMRFGFLEPGIVLLKSAQNYVLKTIKSLRSHYHKVVLQDEETLVTLKDAEDHSDFETSRNHKLCIELIEKVFCWNKSEYQIYARNLGEKAKKKCVITGNMRTWMLRKDLSREFYSSEIEGLKRKHGKFILFNSTFSTAFPMGVKNTRKELSKVFDVEEATQGRRQSHMEWCEQTQMVVFGFLEFVRLFRKSSLSKNFKLIFRPHPSDDIEFYKYIFQGLDEIIVSRKHTIVPWIATAEITIGSTCTTLLEAAMLGKPVISFLPKIGKSIDKTLKENVVNQAGYVAETPADLLKTLLVLIEGETKISHKRILEGGIERARRLAEWNIDTPKCQMDLLSELAFQKKGKLFFNLNIFRTAAFFRLAEKILKLYYRLFYPRDRTNYMFQKFPVILRRRSINHKIRSMGFSNLAINVDSMGSIAVLQGKMAVR